MVKHEEKTSDNFLLDLLQATQTQRVWSGNIQVSHAIYLFMWMTTEGHAI